MNRSKSAKKKKTKQSLSKKLVLRVPTSKKKKQKILGDASLNQSFESLLSTGFMTENKLNESTNNDDAEKSIIDERKKDYLANKKIVMNKATDDNDNVSLLAAAPEKLVDKVQLNMENFD